MFRSSCFVASCFAAMCLSAGGAESLLLRVEISREKSVDRGLDEGQVLEDGGKPSTVTDVSVSTLEVKVDGEGDFYCKTRIGNKGIQIQGRVTKTDIQKRYVLDIDAIATTHTGEFIEYPGGKFVERTSRKRTKTKLDVGCGKAVQLGAFESVSKASKTGSTVRDSNVVSAILEEFEPAK